MPGQWRSLGDLDDLERVYDALLAERVERVRSASERSRCAWRGGPVGGSLPGGVGGESSEAAASEASGTEGPPRPLRGAAPAGSSSG